MIISTSKIQKLLNAIVQFHSEAQILLGSIFSVEWKAFLTNNNFAIVPEAREYLFENLNFIFLKITDIDSIRN